MGLKQLVEKIAASPVVQADLTQDVGVAAAAFAAAMGTGDNWTASLIVAAAVGAGKAGLRALLAQISAWGIKETKRA